MVRDLIPELNHFMTYEGSLTIPGCQETVTWIIINKPATITRQQVEMIRNRSKTIIIRPTSSPPQLYSLRKLMQGEFPEVPKASLGNNFRPLQEFNTRLVRTNIDFKRKPVIKVFACLRVKQCNAALCLLMLKLIPFVNPSINWDVHSMVMAYCSAHSFLLCPFVCLNNMILMDQIAFL